MLASKRTPLAAALILVALVLLPAIPLQASEPEEDLPVHTENVEVTASRLPDRHDPIEDVPAHVTVIDREAIERSGAGTLQELFAAEAGVTLYDQVGNDIEKTFDLRGFTGGTGTKLFLDGAPINDTRNNSLPLHMIPPGAIERIEIVRGAAANSAGSGSEAGTIHLRTVRPEQFGGSVSAAFGSDSTERYSLHLGDRGERLYYSISGALEDTEGFRENSGGDLTRLHGALGIDLAHGHRLEVSLLRSTSDLGNPGALTEQEFREDLHSSPFNYLDRTGLDLTQTSVGYRGTLSQTVSVAANLFLRDRRSEILSTGRAAPAFGGFLLSSDGSATGAVLQVSHHRESGPGGNDLTVGVEYLDGSTGSTGYYTLPSDPGTIDQSAEPTRNDTDRRTVGVFIRNTFRPFRSLSIMAGMRYDRDRIGYEDIASFSPIVDSRTFSELSTRLGANWHPNDRDTLYGSFGETFLPPTVEQMFAFPLFGSNPDLDPQRSRSYEIGYRGRWTPSSSVSAAVVRIDTDDEIIYVPGEPPDYVGFNDNAEATRRLGLEATCNVRATEFLRFYANLSLYDAEYSAGANDGNDVPLVPETRVSAGFHLDLPGSFTVRADVLRVGEQVLDNDGGNSQDRLESYSVVNTRLTWSSGRRGVRLFAEVRNLFDALYATRGIYAYDFVSWTNSVFLTPAPGRRFMAGATLDF